MRNDLSFKNYDPLDGSTRNGVTKNDFAGNPTPKEFHADPDNYGNTHGVGKAVFTVIAASLAAILLFGGALGFGSSDIDVRILSTLVTANEISYAISVPEGEDGLTVALYSAHSRQEKPLKAGDNEGTFKGLASNARYTLEVIKKGAMGDTSVASKELRTKPA